MKIYETLKEEMKFGCPAAVFDLWWHAVVLVQKGSNSVGTMVKKITEPAFW